MGNDQSGYFDDEVAIKNDIDVDDARAFGLRTHGNPLEDIRNTRNVEYVVTNGTMYNAGELWKSVGFKP